MSEWAKTIQRNDLKPCPFCGTAAIEQLKLAADSDTDMQYRINCGNPFCACDCRTHISASKRAAEEAWEERSPSIAGKGDAL